jgi:hypothetical protein
MKQADLCWNLLRENCGNFQGNGRNHEGQDYDQNFVMVAKLSDKVLAISSIALGAKGEIFHQEESWIAKDMTGALTLWVNSNNHPGTTAHLFDRIEEGKDFKAVVFRFGDIENSNSFREEIHFVIFNDGSLRHSYSWGLPGGKFEARSGAQLQKLNTQNEKL